MSAVLDVIERNWVDAFCRRDARGMEYWAKEAERAERLAGQGGDGPRDSERAWVGSTSAGAGHAR